MKLSKNAFELSDEEVANCFSYNKVTYQICEKIDSNVFIINDPVDDIQKVIKICTTPTKFDKSKSFKRFKREIDALNDSKKAKLPRIIKIFFYGTITIDHLDYLYYVMEKADGTLRDLLEGGTLTVDDRYLLCRDILQGLKDLHSIGIYHRDIKPENIFIINKFVKVGDLGLIAFRKEDNPIDTKGEKIGPYGWLSPEVMNKVYTEKIRGCFTYDCDIDEKSDVFQLGKLFWYIFQGNIPIGQTINTDFNWNLDKIYAVILNMTQYSKGRRAHLNDVEAMLAPLASDFNY